MCGCPTAKYLTTRPHDTTARALIMKNIWKSHSQKYRNNSTVQSMLILLKSSSRVLLWLSSDKTLTCKKSSPVIFVSGLIEIQPIQKTETTAPNQWRCMYARKLHASEVFDLTLVWNEQIIEVRNGCRLAMLRTRLSIIVHSTSSSSNTTSFFNAFMA